MTQKNNLTTLYVVRHGETDWNLARKVQGHSDIPLNTNGEKQAEQLAKELREIHFDEAFSSDLVRAKRTAEIVALEKKLAVTTTQALRETTYGKFEGLHLDEFLAIYDEWDKLTDEQKWNFQAADEETQAQAVSRLITFLRETAVAFRGKTILVVCHGGIMRTLLIKLGYGNWETVGGFQNCGYIHLESDGVDFFIKNVKGVKEWQTRGKK